MIKPNDPVKTAEYIHKKYGVPMSIAEDGARKSANKHALPKRWRWVENCASAVYNKITEVKLKLEKK